MSTGRKSSRIVFIGYAYAMKKKLGRKTVRKNAESDDEWEKIRLGRVALLILLL